MSMYELVDAVMAIWLVAIVTLLLHVHSLNADSKLGIKRHDAF
jgi:hypothetical protein